MGNFSPLLDKATGDILVEMGYIPDDTPDHYRFTLEFFLEHGPKLTAIQFRIS